MRLRLSDLNDVASVTSSFVINAVKHEATIMYIHLLLGLRDRELGSINGSFAGTLYSAMKVLESSWKELVDYIESGTINVKADLRLDQFVRCRLESLLSPDLARAQELLVEFEKGFHGIMSRVWPHCAGVRCLDTGSMKIYADILQREHCSGIPFYNQVYGSSERVGMMNLWPLSDRRLYLTIISCMYLEFISEANIDNPDPKTLLADQVTICYHK